MSGVRGAISRALESRPSLRKLVLYSTASVSGVITSQLVLVICVIVLDMEAIPSNIAACVIGAIPNYLINRAWTFDKKGPHSLTREVIPFWSLALLGLIISTFAVAWADQRFDGNIFALSLANIGSFGVLWVGKFFILERILFAPRGQSVDDSDSINV